MRKKLVAVALAGALSLAAVLPLSGLGGSAHAQVPGPESGCTGGANAASGLIGVGPGGDLWDDIVTGAATAGGVGDDVQLIMTIVNCGSASAP